MPQTQTKAEPQMINVRIEMGVPERARTDGIRGSGSLKKQDAEEKRSEGQV